MRLIVIQPTKKEELSVDALVSQKYTVLFLFPVQLFNY